MLAWYDANGRSLGFRASTDPWAILVAEAMAHQTQIERVDPAWSGFMARFPTPQALVEAGPGEALRAWRGLGYNRRAVYLYRAARMIVEEHAGLVPSDLSALQALPGIGPYTARAVAATAFGRPAGAVDTNVRRVLSRVIGVGPGSGSLRDLQTLADAVVPPDAAAAWTHALMDLGALVCRPAIPRCGECPAARWCRYAVSEPDPVGTRGPRSPTGRQRRANLGRPAGRERPAVPFERTSRWLRGRIVDRLREAPAGAWVRLDGPIGTHNAAAVADALAALARDGLIERDEVDRLSSRLPGATLSG